MQTFLPYPDFDKSAECLDDRRLGKQRVETLQILQTLLTRQRMNPGSGWANHPAVRMWRDYELALCEYGLAICDEWFYSRGFRDSCQPQIQVIKGFLEDSGEKLVLPPWLGDDRFHSSHRSNLLRKAPGWYGRFGWKEDNSAPYYWPVPSNFGEER